MFTRDEALTQVEQADTAADLFGPFDPTRRKDAQRLHRRLATALHPDRTAPDDTRAHTASARLTRLHHDWQHTSTTTELRTTRATYRLTRRHAIGSVTNLYLTDGPHIVKVARNPTLNPLLHAEWDALRRLDHLTHHHPWLRPYYPHLHDTSGNTPRGTHAFTVLTPLTDGFATLTDVKTAHPHGLDGRDYAWMHRRLLRAIAGAHEIGLVHGAITTDNVLIHPAHHGIVLAGWTFAVTTGERPLATDHTTHYPPEIHKGQPATTATDIHMAHTLMLDLLAPDETAQRRFARGCTQDDPHRRPDAVDLLTEYDDLLEHLYGERTYRPFALPQTGA
ncbi:adenylate cyclase [Saccharothrix sp. HUAS TT1]|uniref:adenylate cyclase n=1 Tax=unclassified Saccharothrix TaxID=2593673 RepID=UPI00345C2E0B